MNFTLTNLVKGTESQFVCYRDGDLWYKVVGATAGADKIDFEFPVPTTDTGTGLFPATTKSITLMRWIRKHYEKVASGAWS